MNGILAEQFRAWQRETPYASQDDWIFASFRLKGKQPRTANMLVEDHIRPAAVKAGVLCSDDRSRFGFHTLRHSLATFLVGAKVDPKTAQAMLRHSDVATTLGIYAHANGDAKLAAQDVLTEAFFGSELDPVN